jgi:hypothetical protein
LVLTVRLSAFGAVDCSSEDYLLEGEMADYSWQPPTWRFLDPRDGRDIGLPAYPAPGTMPNGSVLHTNGVICAPWNRLAYGDKGGPHSDWADSTAWRTTAPQHTRAHTIPEMLSRLHVEVTVSPGRMAPLPELPEEVTA